MTLFVRHAKESVRPKANEHVAHDTAAFVAMNAVIISCAIRTRDAFESR
jgi:hypothetical protein